tara:strand:- start:677 stop:787 length:111 start_codon:yes stop_codon:yes gene_type:complete
VITIIDNMISRCFNDLLMKKTASGFAHDIKGMSKEA